MIKSEDVGGGMLVHDINFYLRVICAYLLEGVRIKKVNRLRTVITSVHNINNTEMSLNHDSTTVTP